MKLWRKTTNAPTDAALLNVIRATTPEVIMMVAGDLSALDIGRTIDVRGGLCIVEGITHGPLVTLISFDDGGRIAVPHSEPVTSWVMA